MIDDAGMKHAFLTKLRAKAAKRAKLPPEYSSTPFVIALANDEFDLRPVSVLSVLTGSRGFHSLPARMRDALNSDWKDLLDEWGYIGSQMRFAEYGAYFEETWTTDLSGVVVVHDGGVTVQWLPNPFADARIRDPRLLEIGLPLDMLGRSSP